MYGGGNQIYGNTNGVPYIEPPPQAQLPIYNFNTFNVIGYMNCSDADNYNWYTEPCNSESGGCWISKTPLFGNNYSGFFRGDGRSICGWDLP